MKPKSKKVTISGSFRKYFNQILEVREILLTEGIEVLSPRCTIPVDLEKEFVYLKGEESLSPFEIENTRLELIRESDALVVCDPKGYVGPSALLEIGYAYALKKSVFFTEEPKEFILNTLPFKVGLPDFKKRKSNEC